MFLSAALIALVKERMNWDQDHVDDDEALPKLYWDPQTREKASSAKKPKKGPLKFDKDWLETLKTRRIEEGEMNRVLTDITIYFIYLFIVLKISYANRDTNSYPMKDSLLNTLVHGGIQCGWGDKNPCKPIEDFFPLFINPYSGKKEINMWKDFSNVRDVNQWWLWLDTTLMPNVRVQNWYNDDPPYGLRGYMEDRVNRIIGYAIVRQVQENKIDFDFSAVLAPGAGEVGQL